MTGTSPQHPAGWLPDPVDAGTLRYWDGARWTEHTHPVAALGPEGPMQSPPPFETAFGAGAPLTPGAPASPAPGAPLTPDAPDATGAPAPWAATPLPPLPPLPPAQPAGPSAAAPQPAAPQSAPPHPAAPPAAVPPTPHPGPAKRGPLASTRAKVLAGAGAAVLLLAAGGVAFAFLGGDDEPPTARDSPAAERESRPSKEMSDGGRSLADDEDESDATPTPTSPAPTTPAPTAQPTGPGECPQEARTCLRSSTAEFSLRICEMPSGALAYVGGNSEFGYIQLPAEAQTNSFRAVNGGTEYLILGNAMTFRVSPEGSTPFEQPLTSWERGGC